METADCAIYCRTFLISASLPTARMERHGMVFLLVSLITLTVSGSSVIHSRRYSRVGKRDFESNQTNSTVHNVTMDCGDVSVLYNMIKHCRRDLLQLAWQGYPWSPHGSHTGSHQNATNNMRDALDSLNHVCYINDRYQRCLQEHSIRDFCQITVVTNIYLATDFQFICHHRQRDENLVRSLQCLHDNRLLVMLYFHMAQRCLGFGILDDIMKRHKNSVFYTLNINPYTDNVAPPPLYCLPKHVIATCIKPLIDDYCGTMTADLVQDYLLYNQDWHGQALRSAALSSDICENDIDSVNYTLDIPVPHIPPLHGRFGFLRLLKMTGPGTALDTVWGKAVLATRQTLSGKELCTHMFGSYLAYQACVMSSESRSEIPTFNILQFAHMMLNTGNYHGTHCSRLEPFTACWNLLQQICGPKVRGLGQHATLLVEGCKIQSEMDTIGCHWQDMLLSHYIQASQVTAWPLDGQCLDNPMSLESTQYRTHMAIKDLDKVISLLQPGVEEISSICGRHLASRVRVLLSKIRYLQYDALMYADSLSKP